MIVKYYLNLDSDKNLFCQIIDENIKESINMKYYVDPKKWNYNNQKINGNDFHFFTLKNFESYLFNRYYDLQKLGKERILESLKLEALCLLKDSGIDDISKNVFNFYADKFGLNRYDKYIQAFEKFTGLRPKDYKVQIIDYILHFHTSNEIYEMDTYAGKSLMLKEIIQNKRYSDIEELTEVDIWSEIYDENIGKHKFLSKMSNEFEICLDDNFRRTGIFIGPNESLENRKNEIRKMFQKFIDQSNRNTNWIDLAWNINEEILYPLAVITMTGIYDLQVCCLEYCELDFYDQNEEWKSICLGDDLENDDNDQVFYIRIFK
ncbi:hypothetical protein JI747_011155 [Chryseobacterium sp. RG1]|uniref:HTH araC/xylS-type domain-containing protein n=1 Tax=Chryseobacterium tagetis TaxID=2801334 RepID=A0ABS8A168_9FLAO|nr:hypothetical protein [Chryseobacterium tagetis]MCA6067739.1 hypothetical protein [Chryseobacterium tagetis]